MNINEMPRDVHTADGEVALAIDTA